MSAHLDIATRGTVSDSSPTAGARLVQFGRSATVWIIATCIILIAAIFSFLSQTKETDARDLHWNNYSTQGSAALIGVLRNQGVSVSTTESYDQAQAAAADPNSSLVILAPDLLDAPQARSLYSEVKRSGASLTLIAPFETYPYQVPFDREFSGEQFSNVREPLCSFAGAVQAGSVDTVGYDFTLRAGTTGQVCYRASADSKAGALLVAQEDKGQVILATNSSWYQNSELTRLGHAAVAVSTTATKNSVVFYYPNPSEFSEDAASGGEPPAWFGYVMVWLAVVLLTVFVWRGRRMGRLAVETLPVVVPSIETIRGQAGLLYRTRDYSGALRALRNASLIRIARKLAIGYSATATDICTAIAQRTQRPIDQVMWVYVEAIPTSDQHLSELAQTIRTIESEVHAL